MIISKSSVFLRKVKITIVFIVFAVHFSSCALLEFDPPELSAPMSPTEPHEGMNIEEFFGFYHPDKAEALFIEVNDYRQSKGIEPLLRDAELDEVARLRAPELIFYFSRTRMDGSNMMTAFLIEDISEYDAAIARGYETAEDARKAWMNLDYQVENMESEKFTHTGVAVLEHNDQYFWVVVYAQR